MATNDKEKYSLRRRPPEENFEVIATEFDSDIDSSFEDEDDEPLANLVFVQDDKLDEELLHDLGLDIALPEPALVERPPDNNTKKGVPHDWNNKLWTPPMMPWLTILVA